MKTKLLIIMMVWLEPMRALDQDLRMSKVSGIIRTLNEDGGPLVDLEKLPTDLQKKKKFDQIINEVGGDVLKADWTHLLGRDQALVNWEKVEDMNNLIEARGELLVVDDTLAKSEDSFAVIGALSWLIRNMNSSGSSWFKSWLEGQISSSEITNLRWLVYWSAADFGSESHVIIQESGHPAHNWDLWKKMYLDADELGKAIILKNVTKIAEISEDGETAEEIQLLALSGKNIEHQAIALVKCHHDYGDRVVRKWREIAKKSSNMLIRKLAQEVLECQQLELE